MSEDTQIPPTTVTPPDFLSRSISPEKMFNFSRDRQLISPGTYLRKRRIAAGLTIQQAAPAINEKSIYSPILRGIMESAWDQAEKDIALFGSVGSIRIARALPFDSEIYDRLVAIRFGHNLPIPQICRSCGCSWNDPCICADDGPCSWSVHDPELCSVCETSKLTGAPHAA